MFTGIRPSLVIQIALALISIMLTAGSSAQAQDGTTQAPLSPDFQNPPAGIFPAPPTYPEEESTTASSYLQLPGTALSADKTAEVESAISFAYPGCVYAASGNPDAIFSAPVYPPQGATLTRLRAYVYDASANAAYVILRVLGSYGDTVDSWFGDSYGNGGWSYFDITISNHVVDYSNYSYLLRWQSTVLGENMMLCGLRLYYIPQGGFQYLPSVMKTP